MTVHFYSCHDEPFGCFSNFSDHPVEIDGVVWPTTEHYFQAMKFPHDRARQDRIRDAPSPMKAKRIAWEKAARPRSGWEAYRDQVMLEAVQAKFEQHADIRTVLLSTGDEELVENAPRDSYWGNGHDGRGRNKLGRILMKVRSRLREAERH